MDFVGKELITQCVAQFEENTRRIHLCCESISEEEMWKHPNESSNSIANLILHLCGNVGQYVISSLGHQPDSRIRDEEFEADHSATKSELLEKLDNVMSSAVHVMKNLTLSELERTRRVQGFEQSGVHILIHVTEHYSYHTGQIAFWVKLLKNKDLGFYAGIDLNVKNEN